MTLVPAVVISDESERRICYLGLASELCLLQIGHPDDVHPPLPIDVGLGLGRKRRPFHADICSATMDVHADLFARRLKDVSELVANRVSKRDVADDTFAKKS